MTIIRSTILAIFLCLAATSAALALKGVLISSEDMLRLKRDLLDGKITIGKTRLTHIQNEYGEAPNIIDDDRRITYDYGELRLSFERSRLWKQWEKDSFRKPAYTDDVDDLRFDLESGKLVGENITFQMIRRSYGEPTESLETDGDGEVSVYYYGDIKMAFENVIAVKSWRGANLGESAKSQLGAADVFQSAPATPSPTTVPATTPPAGEDVSTP